MEDRKPIGTIPAAQIYVPDWEDGYSYPAGHEARPLYVIDASPQEPVAVSSLPPVSISGTVPVSGSFYPAVQPVTVGNFPAQMGLTDTQLRASPIGVSVTGTVPVSGAFYPPTQPVSGPLTDTQLRAAPVPVSGTFYPATQPVSGPVTNAELRATALTTREQILDLIGTPVTPTITTTAQALSTLAANLFSAGATCIAVYTAGAVLPVLGTVTLPSITGPLLSPAGRTLITQAEAGVMSLKVALTNVQVVIYGYK